MEFQQALNTIYAESRHLYASSGCSRISAIHSIASTILTSPKVWNYLEIDEGKRFGLRCLEIQIDKWAQDENSAIEILEYPICEIVYQTVILMLMKTMEDSEV